MSAMKNFKAITGLHPFNLNRISFVFAFSIATLVIAKLIDAYLFCGFNENFFVDVPLGVILFAGYCITPLLGLAINRKPTTKGGRRCRTFAIVLIGICQGLLPYAIIWAQYLVFFVGGGSLLYNSSSRSTTNRAAFDPFNICGNRTIDNVRKQFRNAMPTFNIFQQIDLIFKIVVALGWIVLFPFAIIALVLFSNFLTETYRNRRIREYQQARKSAEENDTTIIRMEERGGRRAKQLSAVAEHGSIDIEVESAPGDAAQKAEDRKSEVGSVDVRMENLRNEINEPGSNAEPQSKEAKEPEFSIVDEEKEEEATTTTATNKKDSK